ncbi:uncharacterized protein LOC115682253 isoform X2 [Syzygium oleosum]|uniref:uncharacterized protein LOC115682253 isoform X2 n=1 Tax=Syzygium oleosum TaxID=219896 RepID=UPI0024BA919C|nr:uncharacterized protein LOC115682253 isoform X2 [Syzygium oleosum]
MSLALSFPHPPSLHRRRRSPPWRSRASAASVGVMREVKLKPIEATPETFREFGQVVEASPDGDLFGPQDAQLDLSRGIPSVTQCLGSIGGHAWYLGVAKPSIATPGEVKDETTENLKQSRCGHFYVPPAVDDVSVFRISGSKFVKLHRGTWHAGPLFRADKMDFYNLELSNTNEVDHTLHSFVKENGVVFLIDE